MVDVIQYTATEKRAYARMRKQWSLLKQTIESNPKFSQKSLRHQSMSKSKSPTSQTNTMEP